MAPIAFGTQTGGSVIRPAAFCGIFGSKPSWGRTELAGVHELAFSFDTVGWFARSAADLTLLGRLLLHPAWADPAATPRQPRIALCRTPYWDQAQPEARAALDAAAARFGAAGVTIDALDLPAAFADLEATHRVICADDATRAFRREYGEHRDLLSPALRAVIERGHALAPADVAAARAHAEACRQTLDRLFEGYDAILTPSAPGEAPLGLASTGNAVFSSFWSLLHTPCICLPVSRGPNGMPVGVQLIGRRGGDEALLALGEWAAERLA
jgi:Asp-tRNA(Asn)/Glu-tRNA(Gln) amidotransferase A subunit family amidase